jgi:hypothetical protein
MVYGREQIEKYSPSSKTFLELVSPRDVAIVEKIRGNGVLIGNRSHDGGHNDEWYIRHKNEFHATNDSKHFIRLPDDYSSAPATSEYKQDVYGRWVDNDGNTLLPLYEGRSIDQFNFSGKGWVRGKGRGAVWVDFAWTDLAGDEMCNGKQIQPQFLVDAETCASWDPPIAGYKVPIMDVSSATNERSVIAAFMKDFPCNHTLNAARVSPSLAPNLSFTGVLNSFVFDYLVRLRMGGLHVSFFILDESLVPKQGVINGISSLIINCGRLSLAHVMFAPEWIELVKDHPEIGRHNWRSLWAVTPHERLRLRCIIDAVVAEVYGLAYDDLSHILRNDPADPKGFWRVDQDRPVEQRQTTLTLLAFKRLKEIGLERFCAEDWQLPEEVQAVLGDRFYKWQLEGSAEASWAECEEHARKVLAGAIVKLEKSPLGDSTKPVEKPDAGDKNNVATTLQDWMDT